MKSACLSAICPLFFAQTVECFICGDYGGSIHVYLYSTFSTLQIDCFKAALQKMHVANITSG